MELPCSNANVPEEVPPGPGATEATTTAKSLDVDIEAACDPEEFSNVRCYLREWNNVFSYFDDPELPGFGSNLVDQAPHDHDLPYSRNRLYKKLQQARLKNSTVDDQSMKMLIETIKLQQALIGQLENPTAEDQSMKMLIQTVQALSGEGVGAIIANLLTRSSTSSSSLAVNAVVLAIVIGLTSTLASISLRRKRLAFSILMAKFGAIATASAIIISLGSHLPPVLAWTVGPVAFLIMALAMALA